ncbi:MAG: PHP domain-containing protein [Erysipelotrichaceae bacterium]|nr:PHP domain-containing protein [Erysipelotrichaceae bacterium]
MKGKIDLHMHSCYSIDGEFTPKELVQKAKDAQLEIIALSDHNCMKGLDQMLEYGKQANIRVIPAIEFDTIFEGLEVHVLGYNMDYHQTYFETIGTVVDERIHASFRGSMEKIRDYYGAHVEIEETLNDIAKGGNPFQKMYGRILDDPRNLHIKEFDPYRPGGARCEPAVVNFYWDLLGVGTPCYQEVKFPTLKETVEVIHQFGGKAVLAHPWKNFYHREDLLDIARKQGIDGIEAYSNYHEQEHNQFYHDYCISHQVPITCGSDYHGKFKRTIEMGEYGCEQDALALCQDFLRLLEK